MRFRKSFTLIEFVLIISIIAVFISLAKPSLVSFKNHDYKETAREIKSQLEYLRNISVYEKKTTIFKAYKNEYEITIDDITETYYLPDKTYFDYDKTKVIMFSNSGRLPETESIHYKSGNQTIILTVNPISGRVRLSYE